MEREKRAVHGGRGGGLCSCSVLIRVGVFLPSLGIRTEQDFYVRLIDSMTKQVSSARLPAWVAGLLPRTCGGGERKMRCWMGGGLVLEEAGWLRLSRGRALRLGRPGSSRVRKPDLFVRPPPALFLWEGSRAPTRTEMSHSLPGSRLLPPPNTPRPRSEASFSRALPQIGLPSNRAPDCTLGQFTRATEPALNSLDMHFCNWIFLREFTNSIGKVRLKRIGSGLFTGVDYLYGKVPPGY